MSTEPDRPSLGVRVGWVLLALAVSLPAIHHFGRLGFHHEDLSIPFDGGYRIVLGQLPFVDFQAPIGPVLFLQQALFFALFGVGLSAFLTHAAVLNAAASYTAWRLLHPLGEGTAVLGGVVTLAWFYLPPSAPYIDTTAFFWLLIALAAVASSRRALEDSYTGLLTGAAGLAAGLAFLTKQNIGGLGIAGLALLLFLHGRRRWQSPLFLLAASTPLVLLTAWASTTGAWEAYMDSFWRVPLESGRLKYILPFALRGVVKLLRPHEVAVELGPHEALEGDQFVAEDRSVKVVVLRGSGKGFCAGADLAGALNGLASIGAGGSLASTTFGCRSNVSATATPLSTARARCTTSRSRAGPPWTRKRARSLSPSSSDSQQGG